MLRAPTGKRLAPMLATLVPILPRDGELDLSDDEAALLVKMSAAGIKRRLVSHRAKLMPRGRSHTKPGSLLKSQIPIRTWAEWDDVVRPMSWIPIPPTMIEAAGPMLMAPPSILTTPEATTSANQAPALHLMSRLAARKRRSASSLGRRSANTLVRL